MLHAMLAQAQTLISIYRIKRRSVQLFIFSLHKHYWFIVLLTTIVCLFSSFILNALTVYVILSFLLCTD